MVVVVLVVVVVVVIVVLDASILNSGPLVTVAHYNVNIMNLKT